MSVPIDYAFMLRLHSFSDRAFGPGLRTEGISDHIRKELREVEANPRDLEEWADVIILGLDGGRRLSVALGLHEDAILKVVHDKLAKITSRRYPDWRTAEPGKAIEHIRT